MKERFESSGVPKIIQSIEVVYEPVKLDYPYWSFLEPSFMGLWSHHSWGKSVTPDFSTHTHMWWYPTP